MERVCEMLHAARMEKGITLIEAENATKIRTKYLEALEKGKYELIPGRVYALGFLRIYIRFLGLEDGNLMNRLKNEIPSGDEEQKPDVKNAMSPFSDLMKRCLWRVLIKKKTGREPVL